MKKHWRSFDTYARRSGGAEDYGSRLPISIATSSGEAEYTTAAVACMRASHLRMLSYDFDFLGRDDYDPYHIKYDPTMIITDNEATMAISSCKKDTV